MKMVWLVLWVILASPVCVDGATYIIDPGSSIFTARVTFAGLQLTSQTQESNQVGFGGTIQANMSPQGLVIQTSSPYSLTQSVPQLPGGEVTTLANSFGFRGASALLGEVLYSMHAITLHVSSEGHPPINLTDSSIGPDDFGFFVSGGISYFSTGQTPLGSTDLHGYGAPNMHQDGVTLVAGNGLETLRIPITSFFSVESLSPGDTRILLSGAIVATRAIPEPSSAGLLGFVLAVGAMTRRRPTGFRSR